MVHIKFIMARYIYIILIKRFQCIGLFLKTKITYRPILDIRKLHIFFNHAKHEKHYSIKSDQEADNQNTICRNCLAK